MKHIKHYKIFESTSPNFPTTREEVVEVCEKYEIQNYIINDGLSIDVDGDVDLYKKKLEYLPLKFNYVGGTFNCSFNQLKILEGCPRTVVGDFFCDYNELKTLKGSPQTVDGRFSCYRNKLETLEGSPQTVGGDFYCVYNKLKDLEYFPEVSGRIDIEENTVYLLVYTFIKNADSFMIEDFIDYEIIRNRNTVMLDR